MRNWLNKTNMNIGMGIGIGIAILIILLLLSYNMSQRGETTDLLGGGSNCYNPLSNKLATIQTLEDMSLSRRAERNQTINNIERTRVIEDIIGPATFISKNNDIHVGPNTNCTQKPTCKDPPNIAQSMMYTSSLPRSLVGPGKADDAYFSSQTTPAPFKPPCLTGTPYGNSMATYNYWKLLPKLLQLQYTDCDKYECSTTSQNGFTALPNLDSISASNSGASGLTVKSGSGGIAAPLGAPTLACDPVNQDYYNSSEDFCRTHPDAYPCANWWMNNSPQIRDVTRVPGYECLAQFGAQSNEDKIKCGNNGVYNTSDLLPSSNIGVDMGPESPFGISTYSQKEKFTGFCLSNDPNCKLDDGQGILAIKRGREDQALC